MRRTSPRTRSTPVHRINGPGELVQAIPYLLGFHPQDSLVLVGLGPGSRRAGQYRLGGQELVVTARLDLREADEPAVLDKTIHAIRTGGGNSVLAVMYPEDAEDFASAVHDPRRSELTDRLDACLNDAAVRLLDVVVVAHERWGSLACVDEECCPHDGRALPSDPSAFAAAATVAGVVALPDRAALSAVLDQVPVSAALTAAVEAAEHAEVNAVLSGQARRYARDLERELIALARSCAQPPWACPPDDVIARLVVALAETTLRDAIWIAIETDKLDGRPLWRELARRAPGPYAAAPLFLFGWVSWRAGNGALAGMAADLAVEHDPGYSAADLLSALLSQGVDPHRFPRLRLGRRGSRSA